MALRKALVRVSEGALQLAACVAKVLGMMTSTMGRLLAAACATLSHPRTVALADAWLLQFGLCWAGTHVSYSTCHALLASDPLLVLALDQLLDGELWAQGLSFVVLLGKVSDLHVASWKCRCVSYLLVACLCPDGGLALVFLMLHASLQPSFPKRAKPGEAAPGAASTDRCNCPGCPECGG